MDGRWDKLGQNRTGLRVCGSMIELVGFLFMNGPEQYFIHYTIVTTYFTLRIHAPSTRGQTGRPEQRGVGRAKHGEANLDWAMFLLDANHILPWIPRRRRLFLALVFLGTY